MPRIGRVPLRALLAGALAIAGTLAGGCAGTASPAASGGGAPMAAAQPPTCQKPVAGITVDAFDDTQAQPGAIGAGMAELLAGALGNSVCFRREAAGAPPGAATLLIRGSISRFQSPCKGGSLIVLTGNQACVAVELQVIDSASGTVLHSATANGDSAKAGAASNDAGGVLPAALGGYTGTPLEQAMRNCIAQAAGAVAYWYLTEQP